MATTKKKVGTTPGKTTKKPAKEQAKGKTGDAMRGDIEKELRVELGNGMFMDFRVTIASAPKVGPGPRPKSEEMLLMRRLSEEQVLTISAELGRHASAGIKIGSGGPPATGGN